MEYTVLTDDHKREAWQRTVAALEERHYALTMERTLAQAVCDPVSGIPTPEARTRLAELEANLLAVEQQHAAALLGN